MLGNGAGGGRPGSTYRAYTYLPLYLRRIIKWRQMDLEYTCWQMVHLLAASPRMVYRHTAYHKQTKNQWARDDPAFAVLCCVFVAVAAAAYCVAFGSSLAHSLLTILSAVIVDFLLLGVVLASGGWLLANRYLRSPAGFGGGVEQKVEWLYAFDVHCNSYLPLFVLLYVVQYFLCPLLLPRGFLSCLLSNALYALAFGYYHYLNFLGYNALPFLERTELFLYPIGAVVLLAPLAALGGFNPTRFVLGIYFG